MKINNFNKFYLVFASLFFSLMTVCVKKIDEAIPIYELVFFRSVFSLIITSIIIKKKKINPWGKNKFLLTIRGLLGTIALICIFYSIRHMPLSLSTVIQYTYPIFISIFAVFLIKERINFNLRLALFLGWFGRLILLYPYQSSSYEIDKFAVFIAFTGAVTTSLAYIAVKKLSRLENILSLIHI